MSLRAYFPRTLLLALPLCLLGLLVIAVALSLPWRFEQWWQDRELRSLLISAGVGPLMHWGAWMGALLGGLMLAGGMAGFVRQPLGLNLLRKGYFTAYVTLSLALVGLYHLTGLQLGGQWPGVPAADQVEMFYALLRAWAPLGLAALIIVLLHVQSWRRPTLCFYEAIDAAAPPDTAPGDELVENLRSGGRDPVYRRSTTLSVVAHVAVIFVLPWLMQLGGCQWRYLVPKGGGEMQPVEIVVVQVEQEHQRFILNPDSVIAMYVPDLDDSEVAQEVDALSRDTYEADTSRVLGQFGQGRGDQPGWPDGAENATFRFIRLRYDGRGWNDGLDDGTDADRNFLRQFSQLTGLRAADNGEAIRVSELARFEKGYAPPFVYITGDQNIRMSNQDIAILREYLLDGGMLLADAQSPQWHNAFTRHLIPRLFPDRQLVQISRDDPIFNMPFRFPNGPPPLWHHGGYHCLGVRHNNRWVVFYHPGDLGDAWKTGHMGLDRQLADSATRLGVNIVYYAFSNYLRETRRHRQ